MRAVRSRGATRAARLVTGAVTALSILACSGTNCGRAVYTLIPAVEKLDPEFGTEPVPCDADFPTPAPRGCAMTEIHCGETLEGNTSYGKANFGDDFYRAAFCTVEANQYQLATEAIYTLTVPGNDMAEIHLASDCAELDVVAVAWAEDDRCPTASHRIVECEMDVSSRGGSVQVATVDRAQTYLIAVDGKQGAVGNFRLSVDCWNYR